MGYLAAMSLINEVLNELEKRGENVPLGEATIRAIPPRKQSHVMRHVFLAAAVLVPLAAGLWYLWPEPQAMPAPPVAPERPAYALVPALAEAAASQAAVATESLAPAESSLPAAKLSFELSAIPLPDSLRGKPAPSAKDAASQAAPVRKATAQPERQPARSKVADRSGATPAASSDHSPLKQISPRQRVENEFHKANDAVQQGMTDEAIAGYENVLRLDPLHQQARLALVGVLLGGKRNAEAERVLQDGLDRDSHAAALAMLLARLQVERDALPLALETLQKTLPHAERQPEYHAFVAALLQRQERHNEAVTHFQLALHLAPANGVWMMGEGISLQALQRNEDARAAYQRALGSNSLSPQLREFVQQRLRAL
jgi:MSHA biogenesis protein MshN